MPEDDAAPGLLGGGALGGGCGDGGRDWRGGDASAKADGLTRFSVAYRILGGRRCGSRGSAAAPARLALRSGGGSSFGEHDLGAPVASAVRNRLRPGLAWLAAPRSQ